MAQKKINNYLGRNFKKKREEDKLTPKRRSGLMAKIRSKGTQFERDFISELKKHSKVKFERNVASLRGKPDVVFRKQKICIFLDSDFWHGWQYPRWKHLLKNDFWREKIEANRRRDRKNTEYLRRSGWVVLRLWEHFLRIRKAEAVRLVLRNI